MKVLLFGSSRVGSLTWCCRQGLESLGHDTRLIDIGSVEPKTILEKARFHTIDRYRFNRRIRKEARSFDADIFLLPGWNKYVSDRTLRALNGNEVTTANWFPDDLYRASAQAERGAKFDHIFIIGEYPEEDLQECGIADNSSFLTFGCVPDLHRPVEPVNQYRADIGFVGTHTQERESVMADVITAFPEQDVLIIGNGWQTADNPVQERVRSEAVYGEEYVTALSSVGITINMHQPFATAQGGPNMRLFETAGCGTFALHDRKPEMEDLFEAGEIVTYDTRTELLDRLETYVDDATAREATATRTQERAHADHTYTERMRTALDALPP